MKQVRSLAVLFAALALSAAVPACTSGFGLAAPRAFNHPVDVAFACFDVSVAGVTTVLPLANCFPTIDNTTNTRTYQTGLSIHALVPQLTRGEVAAVDLIARTVLDSDRQIPGYTFVAVGELPNHIVVPRLDPTCTYVSVQGALDATHRSPGISIIETRRFRSAAGTTDHAPYVLPSPPADMVLAPDETALWVALPDLGAVAHIPIEGSCTLGPIDQMILVDESVPSGVVDLASADTTRTCPTNFTPVPAAAVMPRVPVVDPMQSAEPVALAFDLPNDMLLVADRGLPLIHRVRLSDGGLDTPLATGVPVRDVVVTPRVPDSYALVQDPRHFTCAVNTDMAACTSHTGCLWTPGVCRGGMGCSGLDEAGCGSMMGCAWTPGSCAGDSIDYCPDTFVTGSVAPAPTTFSRYVYAIDDHDGSVLAIEYSDPADHPGVEGADVRASFGAVLAAGPSGTPRADRVWLPAVARALEITTPQYDPSALDPRLPPGTHDCSLQPANPIGYGLCLPSAAAPSIQPSTTLLRGVFLHVAAADGSIRTFDVYDLDAPCRGRAIGSPSSVTIDAAGQITGDCTNPTVASDVDVYIRRHRPRTAQFLSSFITITDAPTVYFSTGGSVTLDGRGAPVGVMSATDAQTPQLAPFTTACPAGLGEVWGAAAAGTTPAQTTICSILDPFAAIQETWSAVYEGAIPGTATGSAHWRTDTFADGSPAIVIESRIDYCAQGAIGSQDVALGRPHDATPTETSYAGDYLALIGAIPSDALGTQRCQVVAGIRTASDAQQPIMVPIRRALSRPTGLREPFVGQVWLSPSDPIAYRAESDLFGGNVPTLQDALDCYGHILLSVDVRTRDAYVVYGTRSSFSSRVVRDDATAGCRWDPSAASDPLRQGRVFDEQLFRNARIAFTPSGTPQNRAEIRMVLSGAPSPLAIDLSSSSTGVRQMSLPVALRWLPEMASLYAVDTERRGLVEMTMRPLGVTQTRYE